MIPVFRKINRVSVFLTFYVTFHGDYGGTSAVSCNKGYVTL
jgi:hypothetical protein